MTSLEETFKFALYLFVLRLSNKLGLVTFKKRRLLYNKHSFHYWITVKKYRFNLTK